MAATNAKTVTLTLHGRGITGISLSNATFNAGPGSAGTVIGKVIATTMPANQAVTIALGTDATSAKFLIAADGTLSVGQADVPPGDFAIQVTATGQ